MLYIKMIITCLLQKSHQFTKSVPNLIVLTINPSLCCQLDKIIENVMHEKLWDFWMTKKFYTNSIPISTAHAVLVLLKILKRQDNKAFAWGFFVVLQKAFDTVDHYILLHKLPHYRIRDKANSWFSSYPSY